MSTRILVIAHAPLASALRQCALHVFPDCAAAVTALDVQADASPESSLRAAETLMVTASDDPVLVLTDIFGATPSNVAQRLVDGVRSRLVTGVNLPMLLRAITYRDQTLDTVVSRAIAGGTQGVMQVALTAPQNQIRRNHDQDRNDHQQ